MSHSMLPYLPARNARIRIPANAFAVLRLTRRAPVSRIKTRTVGQDLGVASAPLARVPTYAF
jgi:hypothetical protein